MIEKMIRMIEANAAEMATELKARLLSNPQTSSYQVMDDRRLYEEIFELYSRLGHWLLRDPEKGEVRSYYSDLGLKRFEEGFPLAQVVQALEVTKRHVWDTVREKGLMASALELDAAVDFITFLNRFFDMAIYYTTLGYCQALEA